MTIPLLDVRIDPGDHARTVKIAFPYDEPEPWDPADVPYELPAPDPEPDEAWRELVGCLVPGFFGWDGSRAPVVEVARRTPHEGRFLVEVVTTLPPMSRAGVTCLLRALARYASGMFAAHEVDATAAPITSLRALPRLEMPQVPFELEISPHLYKFLNVEIRLESPLTESSSARLAEISKRWARLVQLGAFRGDPSLPYWSQGWLEDASANLDDEWIIRFGGFDGDPEVAGPLCQALTLFHAEQPISSVAVWGR